MIHEDDVTEIRVPRPPAPARLPIAQPPIRYAIDSGRTELDPVTKAGTALTLLMWGPEPPRTSPHAVDVRRPRHARVEDVTRPSWWATNREAVLGGVAGGGLVAVAISVAYLGVWWLS